MHPRSLTLAVDEGRPTVTIMDDLWKEVKRVLDIRPEPTPLRTTPALYLAWTRRYQQYLTTHAEAWQRMREAAESVSTDEVPEWAFAAISAAWRRARDEAEAWERDIVKTAEVSALDAEDSAAPPRLVSMRDLDRLLVMEDVDGKAHRVKVTSGNGTHGWACITCSDRESGYLSAADASADAGYHGVVV